jgi:ABC-type oligopeptide transport system substrate-binding subunit
LRPGLRWSDGNPLTARDFVFAWRRNLDPITGSWLSSMLFGVVGAEAYRAGTNRNPDSIGIEALDDTTLQIRLNHQLTSLLYLLYDPITYPQPSYNVMLYGDLAFEPAQHVCNGAFRVAESQAQRVMTLAHNPWYQGFANGNLDRVELRYVAPRYENYRNGEIDLCRIEDQAYSQSELATQPLLLQYLSTYFLAFAAGVQPFDSIAVRQAFAGAIDQQDLVETVWANIQKPANGGVIPPGMTGHSPECGIPFNPSAASATIKMVGGTQSLPTITLAAIPGMAELPRYLAEQWRIHLGIEIQIAVDVAFEDIVTGMQNGTYQLALVGCDAEYPDAGYFLSGFRPGEMFTPGWNGPQFEALLTEIAKVSDHRQRIAYCHAADRLLVEQETIIVPLYYYQAYGLLRPEYQFVSDATIIRGGTIPLKHLRLVS